MSFKKEYYWASQSIFVVKKNFYHEREAQTFRALEYGLLGALWCHLSSFLTLCIHKTLTKLFITKLNNVCNVELSLSNSKKKNARYFVGKKRTEVFSFKKRTKYGKNVPCPERRYRKGTSIRQAPVFWHLRALRKSPWKFIIWMKEL